jgi:hypothetical protein
LSDLCGRLLFSAAWTCIAPERPEPDCGFGWLPIGNIPLLEPNLSQSQSHSQDIGQNYTAQKSSPDLLKVDNILRLESNLSQLLSQTRDNPQNYIAH